MKLCVNGAANPDARKWEAPCYLRMAFTERIVGDAESLFRPNRIYQYLVLVDEKPTLQTLQLHFAGGFYAVVHEIVLARMSSELSVVWCVC